MIAKGRQVQGKRYKGQQHGMSKLTETEVLHIRALHATGQFYQRELAKQFGVSKDQIKNIVLRKQWRHI
jgi:hypothetical protein